MPGHAPKSLPFIVLTCAGLLLAACASGVGTQNHDAGSCNDNSDCDPGYHCVGGICLSSDDGGTNTSPTITVSPQTLTFAEASLGSPETHTVTITNVGEGTLTLTGVSLSENDTTGEFAFAGPTATDLANGESATVEVTLTPTDDSLDSGQLTIESNDPNTPVVNIELLSSFIGTPDLTVCVDTGQPAPENCEAPAVVDYGQVNYGATAQSSFYIRNDGDGNKTITVEDLFIQASSPARAALFTIDLFTMVETPPGSGTWQEAPATAPYILVSSSGADPDPDALYGRINFTANTDGFLILSGDVLQITTTDTDNPQPAYTTIPITATIAGCPPGLMDMNGDPSDGCEYGCTVTNGGVEACDGLDNDCDGTTDDFVEGCYDGGDSGCDPDGTNCRGICQPGTRTCVSGTWSACQGQVTGQPELCDDLDNDCDGTVNNGLDEGGNSCSSPIAVTALADTSCNVQTINGTITTGDEDWYSISFASGTSSTTFHARLEFTSPAGGGNFRMDVLLDNCSSPVGCESGSNSGITVMDWDIDPGAMGQCPGNTSCSHAINARVRVYKIGGTQCEYYTIQASNGC